MKRLGFVGMFFVLWLATGHLFAGGTEQVISISDSLTDNTNATVFYLPGPGDDWASGAFWAVYEKSIDSSATALYIRNLDTLAPEMPLLFRPHVHFRHPQIMANYYSRSEPYRLFYETDENGNADINYVAFSSLDSLKEPFPLAYSELPETQLQPTWDAVVFQKAGAILFTKIKSFQPEIWTTPVVLDSDRCAQPVVTMFNNSFIAVWVKVVDGRSYLFYSGSKDGSTWELPQMFADQGDNSHPNIYGEYGGSSLIDWKNVRQGEIRLFVYDFWQKDTTYFAFPESDSIDSPSIFSYEAPTFRKTVRADENPIHPFLLSYLKHSSAGDSVFWVDTFGPETVELVSGDSLQKRNSRLFGFNNVALDVWERKINGHWQLRIAQKSYPMGVVEEGNSTSPHAFALLPNYPNPFNGSTVIRYSVQRAGFVELSVWNYEGRRVATLVSRKQAPGTYTVRWNGLSSDGQPLASGTYFCRLRFRGQSRWQKMLFLK